MSLVQSLIYLNDILQSTNKEYTALNVIEQKSKLNLFTPTVKKDLSKIDGPMKIETDSFIKLDNINFKYNSSNTNIIQNLSIDVKKGERIALVGDIGTGKSTILKIILGLVKPTKGDIYLNGKNYNAIEQIDIFKNFGYMTQNPVLFNRSILDNILFGNEGATREDVIKLLEKFGLNVVFNRLEKGIDTLVGKNGSKLSGGQRQVVWFLRIYLHNPDILLMDEPTASLSKESKEQLWKLIKEGFSDKTIIMASHDDYLIKLATRKVDISGFKQNES
jgi:ATP-binding cassette subfamily C protein LapB